MLDKSFDISNISEEQQLALSTWDGEGGAGPDGPQIISISNVAEAELPRFGECRNGSASHLHKT